MRNLKIAIVILMFVLLALFTGKPALSSRVGFSREGVTFYKNCDTLISIKVGSQISTGSYIKGYCTLTKYDSELVRVSCRTGKNTFKDTLIWMSKNNWMLVKEISNPNKYRPYYYREGGL